MAQFTKAHGDFQPVMNYDAASYEVGALNAVTSGATVQPQGPKLDFFTITGNAAQVLTNMNAVISTVQQLATVYVYEYTNAADDTIAIAVYPTGAWTTTTLDDALTSAWAGANVSVATGATFTD
jgi:hypothetical protein